MSEREIDNIFRNGLDDFTIAPSEEAWERFQQLNETHRHHSVIPYISIAASVVLIVTVSLYFMLRPLSVPTSVAHTDIQVETQKHDGPTFHHVPGPVATADMSAETVEKIGSTTKIYEEPSVLQADKTEKQPVFEESVQEQLIATMPVPVLKKTEPHGLSQNPAPGLEVHLPVQDNQKPIADLSGQGEKGNTLRKLLDKALEIKTDNHTWASLRQVKSDFVAQGWKKRQ